MDALLSTHQNGNRDGELLDLGKVGHETSSSNIGGSGGDTSNVPIAPTDIDINMGNSKGMFPFNSFVPCRLVVLVIELFRGKQ